MQERPSSVHRADYRQSLPHEAFIVEVLRKEIDAVLPLLSAPLPGQSKVLDVGCGQQPFRHRLESLGYRYVSTDVEQNPAGTTDFLCEIDKPLPAPLLDMRGFDLLFCTEVLEHVADWQVAFSNFRELVGKGGKVFITCPHFYLLHLEPFDFWRPTHHAFRHFAEQYGFEVKFAKTAGDTWDILGTLLAGTYPQPRQVGFRSRIINRLYWMVQKVILRLLQRGILQREVSIQSRFTFYLSNIVLLEKK